MEIRLDLFPPKSGLYIKMSVLGFVKVVFELLQTKCCRPMMELCKSVGSRPTTCRIWRIVPSWSCPNLSRKTSHYSMGHISCSPEIMSFLWKIDFWGKSMCSKQIHKPKTNNQLYFYDARSDLAFYVSRRSDSCRPHRELLKSSVALSKGSAWIWHVTFWTKF